MKKLLCAFALVCFCATAAQADNVAPLPSAETPPLPADFDSGATAAPKGPNTKKTYIPPYEMAANDIIDDMNYRYTGRNGPDLNNIFNVLGALAGFGCQMSIRFGYVDAGVIPLNQALIPYRAADGEQYFFGTFLNDALLGNAKVRTSVWSLIADGAKQAGAKTLPNVEDIALYNVKTLGTPAFGVPRVPAKYQSQILPVEAVKRNWKDAMRILQVDGVDSTQWGWTLALAGQKLILKNKDKFDPAMAADIFMEAAMPMSKIDPAILTPKKK